MSDGPFDIEEILAAAGANEGDAFGLVRMLAEQHNWAVTVWAMGDVPVENEDESEEAYPPLTEPMRERVSETWEMRKGVADAGFAAGCEVMPRVVIHPNGEFTVHTLDTAIRYRPDGEEI